MTKVFLALFISFVYAAEFLESNDKTIVEVSRSRFDQLNLDTFHYVMTFLSAREVLDLRFLSRGIYQRVMRLWPRMKLFTCVGGLWPDGPVDFSHNVMVRKMGDTLEDQVFSYNRAQLSCVRIFFLMSKHIHNFQAVIDLLPKNSLTSLRLHSYKAKYSSTISKIDFPNLTHLELSWNITLSHGVFGFLPNCMRVLEIQNIFMDVVVSRSLAMALGTMDKLEALSLLNCKFFKDGFSTILENLPISLKRLDIARIIILDSDKLSELGLKRFKEIESLREIDFMRINSKIAPEIALNLPKCITNIYCDMERETLNAFQQRPNEFINVKRIYIPYFIPAESRTGFSPLRKIFPNLDKDLKERIDSL